MYYWAGPKPLFIPFILRWEKIPSRERDKEEGKMLTCLQAAAESPDVNMREGEWNATERRGRHTGVSEHSARGPMAEWCLRDKAEAYTPRVRHRGHCYRAGSLSLSTHALHHRVIKRWRTRWEIQGVPSLGARLCSSGGCVDAVVHKGLEKKKNKGRHESSNCNSLVNSVQRPINMHLQMCCNTFLLRRWYYAAHVAQQLWISLIWWLLR